MKQSNLLVPNVKNTLSTEEEDSLSLLIKGGFLGEYQEKRYVLLPLGMLVMEKIKKIILEELSYLSAIEFQLPVGVADQGEEYLLQLIEEGNLDTTKKWLSIFQIQAKMEQTKEYQFPGDLSLESMELDSYSFHSSNIGLSEMSHRFEQTFQKILERCQLTFQNVIALPKKATQKEVKEVLALSQQGKTLFCQSTQGDYSAKLEAATRYSLVKKSHATFLPLEKKEITPNLNLENENQLTYCFLRAAKQPILLFLAKKDRVNLAKVSQKLQHKVVEVKEKEVEKYFGISYEEFSIEQISSEWTFLGDNEVEHLTNLVLINPKQTTYYENVNLIRDIPDISFSDFTFVQEGDLAPDGQGELLFKRGVKIGQLMKKIIVQHSKEATKEVFIGHYQLSLSLLFLMIAQQSSERGQLNWPEEVAPFDLHLIPSDYENTYQHELTKEVEAMMVAKGYEVLVDDRALPLTLKQAEAEVISCPVEIIIGEKAVEGIVEIKIRASQAVIEIRKEELADTLTILLQTIE